MDAIRFGRLPAGVKRDWLAHQQKEAESGRTVQPASLDADSIVTYPTATTQPLQQTMWSLIELSDEANAAGRALRRLRADIKAGRLGSNDTPLQLLMQRNSEQAALAEIRDAAFSRLTVFQHPENTEALLQALDERPERINPFIARDLLEMRTLPEEKALRDRAAKAD